MVRSHQPSEPRSFKIFPYIALAECIIQCWAISFKHVNFDWSGCGLTFTNHGVSFGNHLSDSEDPALSAPANDRWLERDGRWLHSLPWQRLRTAVPQRSPTQVQVLIHLFGEKDVRNNGGLTQNRGSDHQALSVFLGNPQLWFPESSRQSTSSLNAGKSKCNWWFSYTIILAAPFVEIPM